MQGATVLATEKVISSRRGGAKPQGCVAAGQNVLLNAKRGNEKTMDHVLRSHDQLDIFVHRDVQFIDLAHTLHVLNLPHPLLSHDIDLGRVLRGGA